MRRIWVATFVALISVMLMVGMSQAALLTLESTHNITATLTKAIGGAAVNPASYQIKAGVDGNADWNPSEYPGPNSQTVTNLTPLPKTASAALQGGPFTWLTQTDATTGHATATTFTMAQNYLGSAPAPSSPGGTDGYLSQTGSLVASPFGAVSNYFKLTYNIATAGNYIVSVHDLYTYTYSLIQAANNTNLFSDTKGYLYLYMQALESGIGGAGGIVWAPIVNDTRPNLGNPFPLSDFALQNALPGGDTANLTFQLEGVHAGRTVTVEGILVSYQNASSYNEVVPAPSTMLLLGSGLLGLGLLRRKWSFKK